MRTTGGLSVFKMTPELPPPPPGKTGWPWDIPCPTENSVDVDCLPAITVVTPSYNQGDYLEETLRSVLLQNYPKLQYIVVDGGSTDRSNEILDRYAPWLSHLIRERDEGQSDAICKGIELATGDLFNWINSDDCLLPGTLWDLAFRYRVTRDLYTFSVFVAGEGVASYSMLNQNLSALAILRDDRYSFSQPGLWFRMERLRACGGIDRSLNYGFDWDLLVRYLAHNPRIDYSMTLGAMFRLHDQSKTIIETTKDDSALNMFKRENDKIRDKLERTLPARFAAASRLGRKRGPWNQHLIEMLDDFNRSPFLASLQIAGEAVRKPRVRCSWRTFGTIARLLSRYVRRMHSRA